MSNLNKQLIKREDGSWHVVFNDNPSIAQLLYNAIYQQPNFEFMYKTYMSELTNMLYMNRDFKKKIAYFRYIDGSTIHLNQLSSHWTPPCLVCTDFRKCTCEINNSLDL